MSVRVRRSVVLLTLLIVALVSLFWIVLQGTWVLSEDNYEKEQTRRALGVRLCDFPAPQGPGGLDELSGDAESLGFSLVPRELTGPPPPDFYDARKRIVAKGPDESEVEAYCTDDADPDVQWHHDMVSTAANRRHRYGSYFGSPFHPQNVYIGKRVQGVLRPALFFRDVGSHSTSPHHFAIDADGLCHLMVADVFTGSNNRFNLLWVVGSLQTGQWKDAWLIEHRQRFTYWATAWSATWRNAVHVVWLWVGEGTSDVCYVERTPEGFGRKTRLYRGRVENLDMTVDPDSGRVITLFSDTSGVLVTSRPVNGAWTRPAILSPELCGEHTLSIAALGNERFVVRAKQEKTREFLLKVR